MLNNNQIMAMTDEELAKTRYAIESEQTRRREVKEAPEQIKVMTQRFIDYGGDPSRIPAVAQYHRQNNNGKN